MFGKLVSLRIAFHTCKCPYHLYSESFFTTILLASRYNTGMTLKKMTTYIDKDLLRSSKVQAAQSDGKIYEVINEALRRYPDDNGQAQTSLAEELSGHTTWRTPGVPRESAVKLEEGDTLSEAVIAERESRDY